MRVLRWLWRCVGVVAKLCFVVAAVVFLLFSLANFVAATPREAYRSLHPYLPVCSEGLKDGWDVLAARDPAKENATDDDGWVDPSNDEIQAIAKDAAWRTKLRCALQKHIVPSAHGHADDLTYHLGFLEFKETGEPYPLVQLDATGHDELPSPNLIMPAGKIALRTQLDAIRTHLNNKSNYVIVFIHGWRHNAAIGDGNVADLRHYAAHAARFLKDRCKIEQRFCDMQVTAVYVGWRGARVDEALARRTLGDTIGGTLGTLAAGATLFDRKPVSEQVAPGAITALRAIERTLSTVDSAGTPKPNAPENRMIVFGHSLGGNMLATGLQDDLIKLVRSHTPGQPIPPVLGDLTVLINPASEARKWTSVQREVWDRIAFHVDQTKTIQDLVAGHGFFPPNQKPVIVSVTSALSFPPAGLRSVDCEWFAAHPDDWRRIQETGGLSSDKTDYDAATQDLFPTFKLDFRPLSQRLLRMAARIEGRPPPGQSCTTTAAPPGFWARVESWPARKLAALLVDFPFQMFDQEESHTIGHLDPPRPADGVLTDLAYSSAAPFGTTHELFGLKRATRELHNPYATLADAPLECAPANRWLTRARDGSPPFGTFWDTDKLAGPDAPDAMPPAAHFLHGAALSGAAAITRANDPFWNMRAFDDALARHDGYRLSSFICAMNQLVMDDITGVRAQIPNNALDATQAQTRASASTPPP